jgi:hypothetical protein
MRSFFSIIGTAFLVVLPLSGLAGDGVFDGLLRTVDQAFADAQAEVRSSPLSDEQKSSVSNVLKTRHDTVKNSVGNIR